MKFIAALLIAALSFAPPLQAQEYNFQPAKDAIAVLSNFPNAVQQVIVAIDRSNFGPYPMSGECDYSCFIVCFRTFNWSWQPDFSWFRNVLSQYYGNVQAVAAGFPPAFAPVRDWLVVSLPRFSDNFDVQAERMRVAELVYLDPNSTPEQKAEASATIEMAIAVLNRDLQAGTEQLRFGVQSLSNFNVRLGSSINNVDNARRGLEDNLAANQKVLDDATAGWPCGADDIRNRYNGVKDEVRRQYQAVVDSANRANVTSAASDNAVSVILGTVLNIQNQYAGVLQKLQAAQLTPPGAVQALRLHVASAAWRDLGVYARQQLGS